MNKQNKRYLVASIIVVVLAVVVNAFIVAQSCLNGMRSTESSSLVVNLLKGIINGIKPDTINEGNIDTFTHVVRKLVGHFGLFVFSGIFTSWSLYLWVHFRSWYNHYKGLFITLIFGLSLAALTELIQLTVPNRSGQISDVFIDFAGYIVGTGIIVLAVFIIYKKRNKNPA